ncbi:MAG: hypothetical protein HKP61_12045 [Dactylosporangium sp.]|nr:hypothetical protein [Dactylosporangium sp.]NNJ61653.1 hypothetical protein [Dactylosporangium sp.]
MIVPGTLGVPRHPDHGRSRPPISDLTQGFAEELYYGDDRAAAEYAYVLAVRFQELGATNDARRYARECLRLAEVLPTRSLDDVASARMMIGGIPMPERFHHGVVRSRLADLLARSDAA